MTKAPEFLKSEDKIGIIAPARAIEHEKIELAEEIAIQWGLQPVRGKNLLGRKNQFSGNAKDRFDDLEFMFNHTEIKAILCAAGGYGAIQIISNLDLTSFIKHPKWLIGFSDMTLIHSYIQRNTAISSLHATMPVKFSNGKESQDSILSLKNALFGSLKSYEFEAMQSNVQGKSRGKLIGGNLSILYSLIGTGIEPDYTDKILFIEEVDEYLYHIERMMYSLKLSGKLKSLKGIVVGDFTDIHDHSVPFGKTVEEIILDAVKEFNFPVAFGFPAGHGDVNKALYLNKHVELDVNTTKCRLLFD